MKVVLDASERDLLQAGYVIAEAASVCRLKI
jgi:hypothetical protein